MYVCLCSQITEKDIFAAIEKHDIATIEQLLHKLQIAQNCGQCMDSAVALLQQALNSHPKAVRG